MKSIFIFVSVKTGQSKEDLFFEQDLLFSKIKQAPFKGKANKYLIEFLSKSFKIPQKNWIILSGFKSKKKKIQIMNISKEEWEEKKKQINLKRR